jgi:hypothetical protein
MSPRALLTGLPLLFAACPAAAQDESRPSVEQTVLPASFGVELDTLGLPGWVRPISAAIIPGSGQLMSGQDRGAIYLAVEVFLVVQFLSSNGEGKRERDRYLDLAFGVARAPFAPSRRDTTFEYFEQLERFIESGPFDTDPGPALVPPTDELTYNGSVWKLARETFLVDAGIPDTSSAEYQRALEFYSSRAVGPNFQWSWRDAGLELDLYRQSIERSDDAFRNSTQYLGLLLANHLISAIDAFVSYRLSHSGMPVEIESSLLQSPVIGGGLAAEVGVRIGF